MANYIMDSLIAVIFVIRDCITTKMAFFIFSHFDWICFIQSFWLNMLWWNRGCEYVFMYMRLCVCVEALQLKRMSQFWWNFLQMIWQMFARSVFFSQILKSMTSWRPFCKFSPGLSHGCNSCPIYFKIGHDVELLQPLYAIWNQQNQ